MMRIRLGVWIPRGECNLELLHGLADHLLRLLHEALLADLP